MNQIVFSIIYEAGTFEKKKIITGIKKLCCSHYMDRQKNTLNE